MTVVKNRCRVSNSHAPSTPATLCGVQLVDGGDSAKMLYLGIYGINTEDAERQECWC
jgi:hypothetical protein